MTDEAIENRIRNLLNGGTRIFLGLPTTPGEAKTIAVLDTCSKPGHPCLACGGEKPDFEFKTRESTICLQKGEFSMTEVEIKDRIRRQLVSGIEISSVPPTLSEQGSRFTYCVTPTHRCAACGGENPHFELWPSESKVCLHDRCYWLWRDVETDR